MTRPILLVTLLLCLAPFLARAGSVEVPPGRGIADLGPHLVYRTHPTADLATMLDSYRAGEFSAELSLSPLANNYSPETWTAVDLVNATVDDGRPPDPFAVTLALPLASGADVYLVRDTGLTEVLLAYSIFAPFDPAQHAATRLRTPVFTLAPGERVTLVAKIYFGPFQSFQMALETPADLQAGAFTDGIATTGFYVFALACMLFFVAFFVALRDWVSLLYAQLFLIGLALIGYIDGLLFRFFYPLNPALQSVVGFGLLYALPAAGFALSAQALWSLRPRMARLCLGLAGVAGLGFLAALASPGTYAATGAYALLGVMSVTILWSNEGWRARHGGTHKAARLLAAVTVVAVTGIVVMLLTGWGQAAMQVWTAIKAVYVVLLVATIANFAAQILHIRRLHAVAVAEKVAALQAEAERSRELLESEQAYSRARDLARSRQRQLATASHDFRQPLSSLRMTLDALGTEMDDGLRSRMAEAFDYMEKLSGDYLADAAEDDDETAAAPPPAPEEVEPYPLSLIVETVWQMFHDEAVSKGLRLRHVPSEHMTDVPPMALMRIVSNLVSNAVKYTRDGGVLVGPRRRGGRMEIWVCDTGPGMSAEEIALFRQEGRKGGASQGHGLGLAVCFGLAESHGLTLTPHSEPGRGTVFRLQLPCGLQTNSTG